MLYRADTSEDDVTRTGYRTDWQTAMSNLSSGCIMYQDTKFRSLWDVKTGMNGRSSVRFGSVQY